MKPEIYWIGGPWPGKLAIVGRPRGNDWLEDEILAWKGLGIDRVVSSLTPDEVRELGLEEEERLCKLHGIDFIAFPVPDRSVPRDSDRALKLIRTIDEQLAQGKTVALHCRQGIGRSALLAASLLVTAGVEPNAAFAQLGSARGCAVPETAEQREWVINSARETALVQK